MITQGLQRLELKTVLANSTYLRTLHNVEYLANTIPKAKTFTKHFEDTRTLFTTFVNINNDCCNMVEFSGDNVAKLMKLGTVIGHEETLLSKTRDFNMSNEQLYSMLGESNNKLKKDLCIYKIKEVYETEFNLLMLIFKVVRVIFEYNPDLQAEIDLITKSITELYKKGDVIHDTCSPITGILHDKIERSKQNIISNVHTLEPELDAHVYKFLKEMVQICEKLLNEL